LHFFALSVTTSVEIPGAVIPRRVFTRAGSFSDVQNRQGDVCFWVQQPTLDPPARTRPGAPSRVRGSGTPVEDLDEPDASGSSGWGRRDPPSRSRTPQVPGGDPFSGSGECHPPRWDDGPRRSWHAGQAIPTGIGLPPASIVGPSLVSETITTTSH
jgi:hypothetical protein